MNVKGSLEVILIGFIVIAVLILVGIFSYLAFFSKVSDSVEKSDFSELPVMEEEFGENLEIEPTSLEDCKQKDQYKKDSCYRKVAELKGDKFICKDIQTDFVQDLCYFNIACNNGDISTCEMFENVDGASNSNTVLCYKCVAIKKNDGNLCSRIRDNSVRDDCFANFVDENFNPNEVFSVTKLSCDEQDASLTVKLNEDIGLINFNLLFETPTQGFCIGCSGCAKPESGIDKNLQIGVSKTYNINYLDNCRSDVEKPESLRISFTTDTGDYSTDSIDC